MLESGQVERPRLRPMPLSPRTGARGTLVGRDGELALAALASPDAPLQLLGGDGIGKTALLETIASTRTHPPEGVVFLSARRLTLDEILLALYHACWTTTVPFVPRPAQVGGFLAERRVVVVLDDCSLDRADLDVLLDTAPWCTFVLGSEDRSLWGRGCAEELRGLDRHAAAQLLERELGGFERAEDRVAAGEVAERLGGVPQRLIEAATLIVSGRASFHDLAADARAQQRADSLDADEERILTLLGLLGGAALGTRHVEAVAGVAHAGASLASLERRGWVKQSSRRFRLIRSSSSGTAAQLLVGKLTASLLDHMIAWAADDATTPAALVGEAEAVEATLRLAALDGGWERALVLALASEAKLARSGAWIAWRRVLRNGLEAARSLGDERAEARILHQLGSVALCVGETGEAAVHLQEALAMRDRIGDTEGAELTRHNIRQLGAGGPFWGGGASLRPAQDVLASSRRAQTSMALAGGRSGRPRRPFLMRALRRLR